VGDDELPLLPLPSVLFPGGELRLRIAQPLHLDLIRWCAREQRPFGVCLLPDAGDGEAPSRPVALGTVARIVDFYSLADGMLGISAHGEHCFQVRRARIRDNGLIVAEFEPIRPPPAEPVRPEHGLLVQLLEHLLERVGGPHARAPRGCFDQADWVGWRLAEVLPLSEAERQQLLQCRDQHQRLDRIVARLPELQRD
jgi:uncharacterized protein